MFTSRLRALSRESSTRTEAWRQLFQTSSSALGRLTEVPSTHIAPLVPHQEKSQQLTDRERELEELAELNDALATLIILFPDILPEVFREMLGIFDGESRLHTIVEQLLSYKKQWVKGRWRIAQADLDKSNPLTTSLLPRNTASFSGIKVDRDPEPLVRLEDRFRTRDYKRAARGTLSHEFGALSGSTIDGVLAEYNYSYSLARPTLQEIATKSWRNTISTLFSRWKRRDQEKQEAHFMIVNSGAAPALKPAGNQELDTELQETILRPLLERLRKKQHDEDRQMADDLSEKEAGDANALYECECCFSDTSFEQTVSCTSGAHMMCFRCVQNATSEALFGQGWGRNIDHGRGQIKCLAPTSDHGCDSCIPQDFAQRAILRLKGGEEMWLRLQSRLAGEALLKAQVPLVHCPYCSYSEIDDLYLPPRFLQYKFNLSDPLRTLILMSLFVFSIPLLLILTISNLVFTSIPSPTTLLSTALHHLTQHTHRPLRFQCLSPTCHLPSCLNCQKLWYDQHTCHESATLSLRLSVEGARTAALKRTCPHCGLSFVKDSGCNKLTCVCGYIMCYVCRQGLGKAGEEGYRHFCQHFRPKGGRCRVCERCDLYRGEDEMGVVERAGVEAERVWREREGMVGVKGLGGKDGSGVWNGSWSAEALVRWWVEKVVVC